MVIQKLRIIVVLILFVFVNQLVAQKDTVQYDLNLHSVLSSGSNSPFWFFNGRNGDISYEKNSVALEIGMSKNFQHPERLFDYSFALTGHLSQMNNNFELELHELYINSRFWIFNLSAGSKIETFGNQDETLSSGGLLFSNNTAPIPKVFVGISDFTPVIFKNGFLAIKGGLSHGWFKDNTFVQNMLFHHKFASFRLGGNLPVQFQYGLDHVAQWGGTIPGVGTEPTGFKDFMNVFFVRSGSSSSTIFEQINMGGNHIISQSMRLDLHLGDTKIGAYWQNINEDKPVRIMWNAVNISDGLWGFSLKNNSFPVVKGLVYEYINTTDQNGPYHDKDGIVYGGADDYYNNYLFRSGWTYFGMTIGTPFITSPVYNADGSVEIMNNRVQVHHFGLEGEVNAYNFRILNSYSKNYGRYSYPINKNAVNLLIEVDKHFEKLWGINAGVSLAADWGAMYGRNAGFMLRVSKSGSLFKY